MNIWYVLITDSHTSSGVAIRQDLEIRGEQNLA